MDEAYTAGIIDGEGCLQIMDNLRYAPKYDPICNVASTHKPLIFWLRSRWGGHIVVPTPKSNRKPQWVWGITGEALISLLKCVRPFLKVKSTEAWLILEFWEQRTKHKCGHKVPAEEIALRHGFKLALQNCHHLTWNNLL